VRAIDVTQILAPMLLQIYDTISERERNDTKCRTVRVEGKWRKK
jgi:hypothetical protein